MHVAAREAEAERVQGPRAKVAWVLHVSHRHLTVARRRGRRRCAGRSCPAGGGAAHAPHAPLTGTSAVLSPSHLSRTRCAHAHPRGSAPGELLRPCALRVFAARSPPVASAPLACSPGASPRRWWSPGASTDGPPSAPQAVLRACDDASAATKPPWTVRLAYCSTAVRNTPNSALCCSPPQAAWGGTGAMRASRRWRRAS